MYLVTGFFVSFTVAEHSDYCKDDFNCMGLPHIGCDNPLWNGVSIFEQKFNG